MIDKTNCSCYIKNVMNTQHTNVPMVRNQEKSELEKFALFYEHTANSEPKSRNPTK